MPVLKTLPAVGVVKSIPEVVPLSTSSSTAGIKKESELLSGLGDFFGVYDFC